MLFVLNKNFSGMVSPFAMSATYVALICGYTWALKVMKPFTYKAVDSCYQAGLVLISLLSFATLTYSLTDYIDASGLAIGYYVTVAISGLYMSFKVW